ncbi:MAG: glycosyltransferase family 2 protein [Clostridiaceae bacterium]|nr:glycosyltransferase family 2 protein [Clostridiaceae bacterium]
MPPKNRFAVLIAARNEQAVIARTVKALKSLNYPSDMFDIFVIPNNCTDNTELRALEAGAKIIRCGGEVKNKGDALHWAVKNLSGKGYDAICVFDADNIADPDFLCRMNDVFCAGAKAAKGKCLCVNPYDSWISGCYAIYFGLFNIFYNNARSALDLSAKLNGTGFAVSTELLDQLGGWNTQTIAEDAEFSSLCAIGGHRVWWVPQAIAYDEQPLTLKQSVIQRIRWCGGIMQVSFSKFPQLIGKCKKNPLAFDFVMFLMTPFVQAASVIPTAYSLVSAIFSYQTDVISFDSIILGLLAGYAGSVCLALLISYLSGLRDKRILKAVFTYGIFMFSWIPISLYCLLRRSGVWHEMPHGLAKVYSREAA